MSLADGTAWENENKIPGPILTGVDPAEDGPEVGVITRILATHKLYIPGKEAELLRFQRFVDTVARKMYGDRYERLGLKRKAVVRRTVISLHVDGLRSGAEHLIVLEP